MVVRVRNAMSTSLFLRARIKCFHLNPEVALAIESVSGRAFARTWGRMKCAVFDYHRFKRDGSNLKALRDYREHVKTSVADLRQPL